MEIKENQNITLGAIPIFQTEHITPLFQCSISLLIKCHAIHQPEAKSSSCAVFSWSITSRKTGSTVT